MRFTVATATESYIAMYKERIRRRQLALAEKSQLEIYSMVIDEKIQRRVTSYKPRELIVKTVSDMIICKFYAYSCLG